MAGRPNGYSPEIADRICEAVIAGQTIREICAEKWAPAWETIRRWLGQFPAFQAQYARAREISAESFEAEIIEEARNATPETAAADRLRVDTLKWIAARRAPKVYGDKLTTEHTGKEGGPILYEEVRRTIVDPQHSDASGVRPAPEEGAL